MACASCGVNSSSKDKSKNNGCATGGCNKRNTFDWISALHIEDPMPYSIVEVSFKNGARKDFFHKGDLKEAITGDMVVVESKNGYDLGRISLSGDLVRLQMRKKKVKEERVEFKLLRIASERDLEKLNEARSLEKSTMVKARVISRTLGLDMKIGDVEYQADLRKATFFYTAEGRVDFRELIRHYAQEFRVKIEMRQIGSRQESARIGGLGSCGRELCCSTWLTNFKSVSTSAARYQNLAINQAKLSGQCGRLKCCLNYELDTYMDALKDFPKRADKLKTQTGDAVLIKMDIFKGLMFYSHRGNNGKNRVFAVDKDKVKEVQAMNAKGEKPLDLIGYSHITVTEETEAEIGFMDDVTGVIELPPEKKKRRGSGRRNNRNRKPDNRSGNKSANKQGNQPNNKTTNTKNSNKGKSSGKSPQSKNETQQKDGGGKNEQKPRNKNNGRRKNSNRNNNNNKRK